MALSLFLIAAATSARSGDFVALVGARILSVSGPAIESGTILISGGRITHVGPSAAIPPGTARVNLAGKVVIPGLIDSRSRLLLNEEDMAGSGAPDRDVLDALDWYDTDAKDALKRGVTTAYVSPRSRGIASGLGAVVKLHGIDGRTATHLPVQSALELNLGTAEGARSTSLERVGSYESLRILFRSAQQYARTHERYEREKPATDTQPVSVSPAAPGGGQTRPTSPQSGARALRPRRDPAQEIVLMALRKGIPVRIEAHRSDDIVNALRLADEFKLNLILEGAGEGPRVAKEIARRRVPVIWGPALNETEPDLDERSRTPAGAAKLTRAGIRIALTPGGRTGRSSRFVLENAATAAGHGLSRDAALRAITLDAARILGVGDRIGSIEKGKDADLVVLSADPWSPNTRVEQVYVNGARVHGR